jgi:hypothetical protein
VGKGICIFRKREEGKGDREKGRGKKGDFGVILCFGALVAK